MSIADRVRQEALRQGVDPDLAMRVAGQESGFNQNAISPKGAGGVMQLMPATARGLGVDPTNVDDNIRGGVTYLKQQLDRFKDPRLALAAYNAGPGAVQRAGGVPNIRETKGYVRSIMGDQGQSGADIFGEDAPKASGAAQGGSGEDIFADAPQSAPAPVSAPATAPGGPQVIGASHNGGVTIEALGAAPAPAPRTSQALGLLKGVSEPVDRLYQGIAGNPVASKVSDALASAFPLFAGARGAEQALIHNTSMPYIAQQQAAGVKPGKLGEFGGNMLSTALLPGGPLVNGALTGAALSQKNDIGGVAGDALTGAIGGKIGASVMGGAGKLVRGLTGDALKLAQKGVPLTVGQMAGGMAKSIEDKATSVPILGDVIRNAQRRGLQGVNRAAYNDTLAHIGEDLPKDVDIGRDAYNYTKQRLSDAYDEVLAPLTVAKDPAWTTTVGAAKSAAAKLGDPSLKGTVNQILKTEVLSRFDKAGTMAGEDMKAAQEALSGHINDLSKGTKWSRDAAGVLRDVKSGLEGLVSRTDPAAGDRLAAVNKAYSFLKPLETAAAKPSSKDGIFTMAGLGMGAAQGKSKAALAAGRAPHQELADAAKNVLPSSVPDSGTAGRLMAGLGATAMFGGHLPVVGAAAVPAAGLIGGMASLYSRSGQKALTALMASRNPTVRALGDHLRLLAAPAGTAGAAALVGARQN